MENGETQQALRSAPAYPKAGKWGGRLIRRVIGAIKQSGVELPVSSHILIATSGGSDSVALAHLLVHFGRRVVDPSQVTLLHINHQWRGAESDSDAEFVRQLGLKWGVDVVVRKVAPPTMEDGQSWEDNARRARKKVFEEESQKRGGAWVFTAHQADDLAETLVWRLMTGAWDTHGGGILLSSGRELRPLLEVRKSALRDYLAEVGQAYQEDQTNFSDRFLRSRMRKVLMPEIERVFPRAIEHLARLGLKTQAQADPSRSKEANEMLSLLFQMRGVGARRNHFEMIQNKISSHSGWQGEFQLPEGWRLARQLDRVENKERWILEKSLTDEIESLTSNLAKK